MRDYRDAWDLVRKVDHPHIGLVLDSFHVLALDLPVEPIADIDPAKVFLVEVADLPAVQLDFVEMSRSSGCSPAKACRPIDSFLAQVMKTGYQGFYSVEVFNTYYQTLEVNQVARRAMASMEHSGG